MPLAGGAQDGTLQLLNHRLLVDGDHLSHKDRLGLLASGGAGLWDPTSVLDRRPSPAASPASTLSSLARNVSPPPPPPPPAWPNGEDDWVHHLPPLDMALGAGTGSGWDPRGARLPEPASPHDATFLRWFIGGGDGTSPGVMDDHPDLDLDLDGHIPSMLPQTLMPFPMAAGEDAKPGHFRPRPPARVAQSHHHHQPNTHATFQGAFPSFDAAAAAAQRQHHPMPAAPSPKFPPFAGTAAGFAPALKPKAEAAVDDSGVAAAVDQLAEAAKLAEAGDSFGAREILSRLNHRLPAAPTAGTPLLRSAFYFKEALREALSTTGEAFSSTPVDVLRKFGAHKAFSEVSPVLQFAHFTCVQAVLDELGGGGGIHVLDFDIGVGEQWASLMQELAQLRPGSAPLRVTALVSAASHHHPLELQLVQENLSSFAAGLGVPFRFAAFNLDTMVDPTELLAMAGGGGEAVAVYLPVGSVHAPAVPSVLHLVRRLGAKLVISIDRGSDRGELPFAAHLFQAFQACVFLLESMDAVGTDPDVASKIERFLIQPKVQSSVLRWHRAAAAGDKVMPWRTMLASSGFLPVQISSFAEAQADSLLKKMPVRGFRMEKHAGALSLHWQRAELVSVSAWRC